MDSVKTKRSRAARRDERRAQNAPALRHVPAEAISAPAAVVGWLLRTALLFFGGYAFSIFLGDAAGLLILQGRVRDEIVAAVPDVAWTALAAAVLCSLVIFNRITAVAVPLAAAGGAAVFLLTRSVNVFTFAENVVRCTVNTVLMNLAETGYTVMAGYVGDTTYAFPPRLLVTWGLCTVTAVLTILLAVAILRRVRPVLFGVLCAVVCIPVFLYNITNTNRGVFCVIAFVVGVIALWRYDVRFGATAAARAHKEEKKARRAEKKAARASRRTAESDAMIAAFDAGGGREDARRARRDARREARGKNAVPKTMKERLARFTERWKSWRAARRIARANVAAGGFAGAAAAVVALAALLIPNALVKGNFPIIQSLDAKIRVARIYATAYLMGDDVDLNSLSLYGGVSDLNPRTLSFRTPYFTGERIFDVQSGYNAPVYLRSWVGVDYDPETDTWKSADTDLVLSYRATFGGDFTSDTVGANFKKYAYPLSVELDRYDLYRGYSRYGFIVAQTNVKRVGGNSRLVFTPTYLYPETGFLERGSIEPNKYKVSSYFDGVYSSRFFAGAGRAYSTYSFITVMRDENLGATFDAQTRYFADSLAYTGELDAIETAYAQIGAIQTDENGNTFYVIEPEEEGGEATIVSIEPEEEAVEKLLAEYEEAMKEAGATWRGDSILAQYIKMTPTERAYYRFAYVLEDAYRKYAHETYTTPFAGARIRALATETILSDNGWHAEPPSDEEDARILADRIVDAEGNPVLRHDLVMAVVRYLRGEDFTYTLTPEAPEAVEGSTLDAFLFEVKQGYCVHFATAAVAILREYGLPVRYDEGYVASGFRRAYGEDVVANFMTSIYDYNAHAWIEVYFPYMGWVQYEVTPNHAADMYDSEESYAPAYTPPAGLIDFGGDDESEETILDLDDEEEEDNTIWIVAGVLLAVAALTAAVVWLIRRRGERAMEERRRLVAAASDERRFYSEPSGENRRLARRLDEAILRVFRLLGCPPQDGELHAAYAQRIDTEYGALASRSLGEVLPVMEKEEFGGGLNYPETRMLADYLEQMTASVYAGLSWPRKIWLRYFRRAV